MNCKKLFALVLSLVFICSSFLVVSAETPDASVSYVEVTVTETGLAYAAYVPASVASATEEFAVTFTQNDVPTAVTEHTTSGSNYVYSFASDTATDVLVAVGDEKAVVCAAGRFNGAAGSKYVVYTTLTLGNANGDTATDIKDIVRIKKIVADAEEAVAAADIDGDGEVFVDDLVLLAKYIITAKKGILVHTVTFMDANGKVLSTVTVPSGFKAVPTVVPTKNSAGYDFEGWDTSLADITADAVITAVYSTNISGTIPGDWEYDD